MRAALGPCFPPVSPPHGPLSCCARGPQGLWEGGLLTSRHPAPQEHVQKVFQKQESTEEMLHRRQASLKKLAAKQTRPVQPVAPRPEALTKSPCASPGACTPRRAARR